MKPIYIILTSFELFVIIFVLVKLLVFNSLKWILI